MQNNVKTLHLSLIMFTVIVFLGFGLKPVQADDTNDVSIQNIQVQPSMVKVGNTFTVTATLVNNSTVPIVVESGTCVPIIEHVPFFTVILDNHTKIKAKNLNCAGVGLSQILNPGKNIIGTSPDSTLVYIATESGTANVTVTFSYHVTNQTDPTQPNIEQTITKSFLFTINDNSTRTKPVNAVVLSPLKQFKSGITAKDVHCNTGFVLAIKSGDNSPACVTPQTKIKLVDLGWAVDDFVHTRGVTPFDTLKMNVYGTIFSFNYTISGGQLENATADVQNKSLTILIKTVGNGGLTVDLPRALIDPQINGQDSKFIIIEDGKEVEYMQIDSTVTDRVLTIPFQYGVSKIEIIAPEPIR